MKFDCDTPNYIIFARKMLDVDSLPVELEERLNQINFLVIKANEPYPEHYLRSSQVTAMVVEQYLREQNDKR